MEKAICGELNYNNGKYYFNFKNNILVIQPRKMENHTEWMFSNINIKLSKNAINIEG